MPIPADVQVGPYRYEIVMDADAVMRYEHENESKVYGAIKYMEGRILIDPANNDQKARVTLLHEVMHGCNHTAGCAGIDNEERIVQSLAHSLLDTLRRNPDLVAYLLED